jgi:hypothetical protein
LGLCALPTPLLELLCVLLRVLLCVLLCALPTPLLELLLLLRMPWGRVRVKVVRLILWGGVRVGCCSPLGFTLCVRVCVCVCKRMCVHSFVTSVKHARMVQSGEHSKGNVR